MKVTLVKFSKYSFTILKNFTSSMTRITSRQNCREQRCRFVCISLPASTAQCTRMTGRWPGSGWRYSNPANSVVARWLPEIICIIVGFTWKDYFQLYKDSYTCEYCSISYKNYFCRYFVTYIYWNPNHTYGSSRGCNLSKVQSGVVSWILQGSWQSLAIQSMKRNDRV